jgi:hypothetical protein
LKVNSNSWHTRLYKSWYKRKYGREHNGSFTNLCPYMRAVMFWSWMRPLFMTKYWNLIPITALLIEVPRWAGMLSYNLKTTLYLVYGVASGMGVIITGAFWLAEAFDKGKLEPITETAESFGNMLVAYGRSAHDRVCPEIEIIRGNYETNGKW